MRDLTSHAHNNNSSRWTTSAEEICTALAEAGASLVGRKRNTESDLRNARTGDEDEEAWQGEKGAGMTRGWRHGGAGDYPHALQRNDASSESLGSDG